MTLNINVAQVKSIPWIVMPLERDLAALGGEKAMPLLIAIAPINPSPLPQPKDRYAQIVADTFNSGHVLTALSTGNGTTVFQLREPDTYRLAFEERVEHGVSTLSSKLDTPEQKRALATALSNGCARFLDRVEAHLKTGDYIDPFVPSHDTEERD